MDNKVSLFAYLLSAILLGLGFYFALKSPVAKASKSPQVSVGNIILYTVGSFLIVAALSKGYVTAMRETARGFVHMLDAQTLIWPCAIS